MNDFLYEFIDAISTLNCKLMQRTGRRLIKEIILADDGLVFLGGCPGTSVDIATATGYVRIRDEAKFPVPINFDGDSCVSRTAKGDTVQFFRRIKKKPATDQGHGQAKYCEYCGCDYLLHCRCTWR